MNLIREKIVVFTRNVIGFFWYRFGSFFFRMLPIRKNRIVFQNFFGKGYGDNPKYLAEEILRRKGNYELIWLIKYESNSEFPETIKAVKRGTIKELYYLSTAKVWIDNSRKPYGVVKRKEQYYIQTWHGALILKKIEKDVELQLPWYYLKSAKHDSKMIDMLLSGSQWNTNYFRSVFWYDGEIAEIGTPKTDLFFRKKYNREIYLKKSRLDISFKYILYAPTFRETLDMTQILPDFQAVLKNASESLGEEWKILVRFHPNIVKNVRMKVTGNNILDVSEYSDINDLLFASDVLITDYSSCMFDAMFANIPVILYMPDLEEYLKVRGMAMDINLLPFPKTFCMDELLEEIKNINLKDYKEKKKVFLETIKCVEDGNAAERVVDKMIENLC